MDTSSDPGSLLSCSILTSQRKSLRQTQTDSRGIKEGHRVTFGSDSQQDLPSQDPSLCLGHLDFRSCGSVGALDCHSTQHVETFGIKEFKFGALMKEVVRACGCFSAVGMHSRFLQRAPRMSVNLLDDGGSSFKSAEVG